MRLPSAGAKGRSRARAGRHDDMLGGQDFRPLLAGHFQLAGGQQLAIAHVDGNLVLLHQMRDALIQLLGHAARTGHHGGQIGGNTRGRQAVGLGMLHLVKHFGAAQQGLGRDTAPVEADAAQIFAFDNRGLETQLCRADRRDIATGARTQNNHIIRFSHVVYS